MRKVDELLWKDKRNDGNRIYGLKIQVAAAIEAAIAKATTTSQRYYDNAVTEGHSKMHIHYIKYLSVFLERNIFS
uniref:Uncharacterized protein n=1 Tax=Wuchereria bancrofti TaxID=6293 RepID=A0AAF5PHA5_WUCBA